MANHTENTVYGHHDMISLKQNAQWATEPDHDHTLSIETNGGKEGIGQKVSAVPTGTDEFCRMHCVEVNTNCHEYGQQHISK